MLQSTQWGNLSTLCASRVSVQEEKLADALPEMRLLFPAHFKELGVNQNRLTLHVDEPRYFELERLGMLFVLTVRSAGALVGYFTGFCMTHFHYADAGPWAMTDMYFIKPEYRNGAGVLLFRAFKQLARDRGCRFAVTSCKVHEDHTEFFEKLGAKWTDKTFIFALEDECQ